MKTMRKRRSRQTSDNEIVNDFLTRISPYCTYGIEYGGDVAKNIWIEVFGAAQNLTVEYRPLLGFLFYIGDDHGFGGGADEKHDTPEVAAQRVFSLLPQS